MTGSALFLRRGAAMFGLALLCVFALGAPAGAQEGDDPYDEEFDCVPDTSTADTVDTHEGLVCPTSDGGGGLSGGGGAGDAGGGRDSGADASGVPTRIDAGVGGAPLLAQAFDDCRDTDTADPDEPVTDTDTFVDCAGGGGMPTSGGARESTGDGGRDVGADGSGVPTRIDAGAGGAAQSASSAPVALVGLGAAVAAGLALLRRRA